MNKSPTLRDLAILAGVSHQTVALAIRNSPKVASDTRKRVQLLAKKNGYRRNPSVSAWTSYVRTKKAVTERSTLAFITPIAPNAAHQYEFYTEFYEGARHEADSLGYRLDFFALSDYNQDWLRIRKIMRARNIAGCLIFSQFLGGGVELPLADFAVVCLDRAANDAPIDFASSDHYKGMTLALDNLRRLGYRRIGYFGGLNPNVEDLSRWRGAFAADLLLRPRNERIPIQEFKEQYPAAELILKWWSEHQPDAIISSFGHEVPILRKAGIRVPQDVAVVSLDIPQTNNFYSGINQRLPWVAAAAMRLLVEKVEKNELGPPEIVRGIVIQPAWKEGKSAPSIISKRK